MKPNTLHLSRPTFLKKAFSAKKNILKYVVTILVDFFGWHKKKYFMSQINGQTNGSG
jgi:hypothetical protein